MAGLTFITVQSRRTGEWAAGYMRPTAPGCFVPLVIGCPNELAATGEAQRLATEAEQRAAPVIEQHQFRVYGRGAFAADDGVE